MSNWLIDGCSIIPLLKGKGKGKASSTLRLVSIFLEYLFVSVFKLLKPSGEPATIKWITAAGRTSAFVVELQRKSAGRENGVRLVCVLVYGVLTLLLESKEGDLTDRDDEVATKRPAKQKRAQVELLSSNCFRCSSYLQNTRSKRTSSDVIDDTKADEEGATERRKRSKRKATESDVKVEEIKVVRTRARKSR